MATDAGQEPIPTLISLFRRSARVMVDELLDRLEAGGRPGITASEHLIFESLPPGGARLTEVAARAGMSHQAAGELVTGLQARGLVERRPDPSDGRARLVVLTPAGRDLVRAALAEIAAIERAWTERLAEAGVGGGLRAALRDTLARSAQETTT